MKVGVFAHFVPHAYTKRRAKLLTHNALLSYIFLLLLVLIGVKAVVIRYPGVLGYASNINTSDLYKYTNVEREKFAVGVLTLNPDLSKAATEKANDMFKNNYWSHVSPSGVEPWYFFSQVGYDYTYAGENLAKNFNDSKSVVKAWMNSPSHKDNMLSPNYTDIGFAVVNGVLDGYETTLVVQFFGTKRVPLTPQRVESGLNSGIKVVPSLEQQEMVLPLNVSLNEPKIDVFDFTRIVSLTLGAFMIFLLALDFWYSSTRNIVKVTGHTLAHLFLLIMAIVGIGLVMVPGTLG